MARAKLGGLLRLGVGAAGWASTEPFSIGVVANDSVEPFDLQTTNVAVDAVEPFDIEGNLRVDSVEPFNLSANLRVDSEELFDIQSPSQGGSFGPGEPASPTLGYWDR